MIVSSTNNFIVPLESNGDGTSYFALFNALAGSIEVIDQDVAGGLATLDRGPRSELVPLGGGRSGNGNGEGTPFSNAVTDYLSRRGYLFASRDEEREQSRQLYDAMIEFHRTSADQPILIIPTYNCNLRCSYCWQRLYHMDSSLISREMVDHFFRVLPQIANTSRPEKVNLTVFGGEPLQEEPEQQERVVEILDRARKEGFGTSIITNGVGLEAAVPLIAGKCDAIQMTLDGPPEIHRKRRPLPRRGDSFAAGARGITAALEAGLSIRVRVNIDTKNLPHLPELADIAREMGWLDYRKFRLHLAPVKNHNPRKPTYPESQLLLDVLALRAQDERMKAFDLSGFSGIKYFNAFKDSGLFSLHRFFSCEAQINFWGFDLHGHVYPCWDSCGLEQFAVGRFYPDVEIDEVKLAGWRRRNALDIAGCDGCVAAAHCGGGCQFIAHEHQNRFDAPSCDGLMEGYRQAFQADSAWLIEHAKAGDHAIGLVTREGVKTAVDRPFGLVEDSGNFDPIACG